MDKIAYAIQAAYILENASSERVAELAIDKLAEEYAAEFGIDKEAGLEDIGTAIKSKALSIFGGKRSLPAPKVPRPKVRAPSGVDDLASQVLAKAQSSGMGHAGAKVTTSGFADLASKGGYARAGGR